jgi:hypothetical protein
MMDNKKEMQVADMLDKIRTRNARTEKGRRGRVEEKALAAVREAAVEHRSKADREDDEIARKAFMVVKTVCEQSPQNDFSWEAPGLARQSKGPGRRLWLPAWRGRLCLSHSLGLNYGSDSD